jgi:lipoyl(octanoyl) transferase
VVTLGRGSEPQDIDGWDGPIIEIRRGGRATYHGPSQLVVYPIVNLNLAHRYFKSKDLHGYLRVLEMAIIESLKILKIQAKTIKSESHGEKKISYTGVWVKDRKIASLGIAVKKWVTYHGVAINIFNDHQAFKGINPCGFSPEVMISAEELVGNVHFEEFKEHLKLNLFKKLNH